MITGQQPSGKSTHPSIKAVNVLQLSSRYFPRAVEQVGSFPEEKATKSASEGISDADIAVNSSDCILGTSDVCESKKTLAVQHAYSILMHWPVKEILIEILELLHLGALFDRPYFRPFRDAAGSSAGRTT